MGANDKISYDTSFLYKKKGKIMNIDILHCIAQNVITRSHTM
jgi:hypothetical protein